MSATTDTPVKTAISATMEQFEELLELINQPTYKYSGEVRQVAWEDELGRFRMWASAAGFWKSGAEAVDSRISRHNSTIIRRVPMGKFITDLLQELQEEIREVQDFVGGTSSRAAGRETPSSGTQNFDQRVLDFSVGDSDGCESSNDAISKTELQNLLWSIHELISDLNEYSNMILEDLREHSVIV